MITNIFSRSNPMNFAIIAILFLIPFILTVKNHYPPDFTLSENIAFFSIYPLLMFSSFLIDFMSKKNSLNKSDDYALLFFTLYICLIPDIFKNFPVVISNLFVLFAFRRLLSIQSLIAPKQKIFDASFWITIAAVFHFDALWFLLLVFVSIIIHVSNDIKNWIIPLVGVFTAAVLILLYSFMFDSQLLENLLKDANSINFNLKNISEKLNNFSTVTFIILAMLLLIYQISTIGNYLTYILNSVRKIIIFLFLILLVYIITDKEDGSILLYGAAPMAIASANLMNSLSKKLIKESIIMLLLVLCVMAYL